MRSDTRIHGERICLRDFTPEDTDDVFEYASDPLVTRYAGWIPHQTPYDSMAYIQRCLDRDWGPITFAIEALAEGRVIGVVDIRIVSRFWGVGEIGYTLARSRWGRGFNVEAGTLLLSYGFEKLGLRRIQAVCDVFNRRSYRTMEKLGMVREQIVANRVNQRGEPVDRVMYSILKRQWLRRTAPAPLAVSGAP
jgi:ribosomal-protein-alanine N-acetyltransferase